MAENEPPILRTIRLIREDTRSASAKELRYWVAYESTCLNFSEDFIKGVAWAADMLEMDNESQEK